jgi:hypothetical protein
MAAHLEKAAVENTFTPDEHRIHRGAHVIVDALLAGASEESKRLAKDVESTIKSATAFLYAASAILLLRRRAR